MRELEGKNAIISGANRGIGKSILEVFAKEGCNIWACCRQVQDENLIDEFNNISKENEIEIWPVYLDLANEDSVKKSFQQIYASRKKIDILVNAAGIVNAELFQMTSMKTVREVFEVDFFGAIYLTQYVLRVMQRYQSGSIINIASISGLDINPTNCTYGSAKAALIHFSQILASEVGRYNIRVNAVAPGPTNTSMIKVVENVIGEENMLSRCALSRLAEPDEIANVVAFLASDRSSFINGQVIRVDGGSK